MRLAISASAAKPASEQRVAERAAAAADTSETDQRASQNHLRCQNWPASSARARKAARSRRRWPRRHCRSRARGAEQPRRQRERRAGRTGDERGCEAGKREREHSVTCRRAMAGVARRLRRKRKPRPTAEASRAARRPHRPPTTAGPSAKRPWQFAHTICANGSSARAPARPSRRKRSSWRRKNARKSKVTITGRTSSRWRARTAPPGARPRRSSGAQPVPARRRPESSSAPAPTTQHLASTSPASPPTS